MFLLFIDNLNFITLKISIKEIAKILGKIDNLVVEQG